LRNLDLFERGELPSQSGGEKALNIFEWLVEQRVAKYGFHRMYTAIGFSAGLASGMKITDAIWAAVPWLQFDKHSDKAGDKIRKIAKEGITMVLGAVGVIVGSNIFFEDREKDARKNPQYLEDYHRVISQELGGNWKLVTGAAASIAGTSGGWGYSGAFGASLGAAFGLRSDIKPATMWFPGLGKLVAGSRSNRYFEGPKAMLDKMGEYLLSNKEVRVDKLYEMLDVAIGPLFADIKREDIIALERQILEWHGSVWNGKEKITDGDRTKAMADYKAKFTQKGLEDRLVGLGYFPEDSSIFKVANHQQNVSGAVGVVGKAEKLEEFKDAFMAKFAARHQAPNQALGQDAAVTISQETPQQTRAAAPSSPSVPPTLRQDNLAAREAITVPAIGTAAA
jgi:hypothetical protein